MNYFAHLQQPGVKVSVGVKAQTLDQLFYLRNPDYIRWAILTDLRESGPVVAELPVNALRQRIGYPDEMDDHFVASLRQLVYSGEIITNYHPEKYGVGTKYLVAARIGQAPRPCPAKSTTETLPQASQFLKLAAKASKQIEAKPKPTRPVLPAVRMARRGNTQERLEALCVVLAKRGGRWTNVTSSAINLELPSTLRFAENGAVNYFLKQAEIKGLIKQYGVSRGKGRELIELFEKGFQLARTAGWKEPEQLLEKPSASEIVRIKTDLTLERELAVLQLAANQPEGILMYGSGGDLDLMLPLRLQFGTSQGIKYVLRDLHKAGEILLITKRGHGKSQLAISPKGLERLNTPG